MTQAAICGNTRPVDGAVRTGTLALKNAMVARTVHSSFNINGFRHNRPWRFSAGEGPFLPFAARPFCHFRPIKGAHLCPLPGGTGLVGPATIQLERISPPALWNRESLVRAGRCAPVEASGASRWGHRSARILSARPRLVAQDGVVAQHRNDDGTFRQRFNLVSRARLIVGGIFDHR